MPEPMTVAGAELDLTSLASGSRQAVFLPTGAHDHEWVYKLPCTSGMVEHYGVDLGGYRPTGPVTSMLYRAFVQLPNDRHARHLAALEREGVSEHRRHESMRRHRLVCEARGRSVAVVYRWTRRRHFQRMIALAEWMAARGLAEVMLPFRLLRDATATLRIGDRVELYHGHIFAQRRADFFDRSGRFDAFEWDDVILAQHRLWREGVGLSDANEILGPKNWALVARRLRLADLSSLTRSARTVRRLLSSRFLDERQGRVLQRLAREGPPEIAELAARYFEHVRAEINQSRFDALWRRGTAAAAHA